jgi:hypothetical protein
MSLGKLDLDSLRSALESKRADLMRVHDDNLAAGTHSEEGNFLGPVAMFCEWTPRRGERRSSPAQAVTSSANHCARPRRLVTAAE